MKLTIKWLKQWVNTQLNDEELVQRLTMAGLEVDGLLPVCGEFNGVVVGEIISAQQHENADKLKVCKVDTGAEHLSQIICGAANARAGIKVAVATIGANLPGFKIKKAKLRGLESCGMLCSAGELELNKDLFIDEGILELNNDLTLGDDLRAVFELDNKILELDITPNRGDCFSVKGVAREVAIYENLTLLEQKQNLIKISASIDAQQTSHILAPEVCPSYLTRVIKGVDNTITTPDWMAQKLAYSGQKLHSLVVDVTNYVLLELGQPLHAFDLDKISGDISVRLSKQGEKITLLNDQEITLNDNTVVITDEQSILALGGIMGGLKSSNTQQTKNILLESAFFEPVAMAGKARDYGLHTESSLRFERGVDFNGQASALERASALIIEIAGGQAGQITHNTSSENLPSLPTIHLRKTKLDKILGFELDINWIKQQFELLDFQINKIGKERQNQGDFWITAPSFRFDIRIEADLIEELARLYGYDKLPTKPLSFTTQASINKTLKTTDLTNLLVVNGYNEVINYSFISQKWHDRLYDNQKPLRLKNPISESLSIMRTGLVAGLLQSVIDNKRYGHDNGRFFETGLCFEGINPDKQTQKIGGVIIENRFKAQWSQTDRSVDFYDVKNQVEALLSFGGIKFELIETTQTILHPKKGADVIVDGENIGFFGALSPIIEADLSLNNVYIFELSLMPLKKIKALTYQSFSNRQDITRDISILLDDIISYQTIKQSIFDLKQDWLIEINLFDVYRGEPIAVNKKSLSISLTYQADKTLLDKQIDAQVMQIINKLNDAYGAVQR